MRHLSFFACVMVATASASFADAGAGYRLYNVVPMYLGHEAEQAARCVEMFERTGEDTALYSLTLHPEGRPATDKVDKYVASYRAFAAALKGTKVKPGILVQAILGHWPRTDKDIEPWERTIDQDGKTVRFCPLDPGFGAYIDYVFTALARERPSFILTDDDVRAYSHGCECFCATHVKLFNARRGTNYDSDALRAAVAKSKPGEPDYDAFFRLQREMMEDAVVGRIRRAIDSVDPSIQAGICIAGEEHRLCAPLARRIAARGQTPVMRCATGLYAERMSADRFPRVYMRMLGFEAAYRGSGIDLLDEADTCPQNLWSKSARSFMTHLVASCFVGMKGAKTWYVNGIRATGIPVSGAYTDVLAGHRGRLGALAREVEGSSFAGLAVPCFKEAKSWHMIHDHGDFFVVGNSVASALVPFGVPITASADFGSDRLVFALGDAAEVDHMSDGDLERMFSGRVLVLRDAALALVSRGRADLIGVEVEKKPLLFSSEQDMMNNSFLAFSPSMDGSFELRPAPGCETISRFVFRPYAGAKPEPVSASAVLYRNALGGRVVTSAFHAGMMSLHQFSEGRKRWLTACLDRLVGGRFEAICGNDQDVLVSERVKPDGTRLVLAVNLNSDPISRLSLRLAGNPVVEALSADGKWRRAETSRRGEFIDVVLPLGFYEAGVVRTAHVAPEL